MANQKETSRGPVRAIPLRQIQDRLLDSLGSNSETGIADAVDLILSQGAYHGASDVHLEPWADYFSVRYRVDGILQQIAMLPQEYQLKLSARLKVLADLVVYRKDTPQDGRIDGEKSSSGRPMRVSTIPTVRGEKTVIRLLGDTQHLFSLDALGFPSKVNTALRALITRSQGTLLLTGPSSTGKTTTIYALLREMMHLLQNTTNIVTIEDPVEYNLDKLAQIQVNPHAEFTFSKALRAILRQDPEVIMVGEIRDFETARMAIQSGLTGHFVISTIHSGTSAGVFTRLLDMGVEPFLVASAISGVLAQRLVRLNCPDCTYAYEPDPILLRHFRQSKRVRFFRGKGCDACKGIGYRGRAAIGEMLMASQEIVERVLTRPTTAQLHALAVSKGMGTLSEDGYEKATKGITTIEELLRVLPIQ